MPNTFTTHPEKHLLVDYKQGRLAVELCKQVASHVRLCATCYQIVHGRSLGDGGSDPSLKIPGRSVMLEQTETRLPTDQPAQTPSVGHTDPPRQGELHSITPNGSGSSSQLDSDQTTSKQALAQLPDELKSSSRFSVIGRIGQGGMGTVWKARHNFLDCFVAIKVMRPTVGDHPQARARFLDEMRAVGKLQHNHIARAHDAEQLGALLILVMEYVEGVTLDRLVEKN